MAQHIKVITWARWRVQDPFSPEYCTVFTASILKPSWEFPLACASMVVHKGLNKVFMRMSYEPLQCVFVIPNEYKERLDLGFKEALRQASYIQQQQKALHKISNLEPGAQVVRTDTGEILAEAERIINEQA